MLPFNDRMFDWYPDYEYLCARTQLVLFTLGMGMTLSLADFVLEQCVGAMEIARSANHSLFELALMQRELGATRIQVLRHRVERVGERADLIRRRNNV